MSGDKEALRRKALLDALLPDDELRHLWLTDPALYNTINVLVRTLPLWVDRLADWAKASQPRRVLEMQLALANAMTDYLEDTRESVDAEHLADYLRDV